MVRHDSYDRHKSRGMRKKVSIDDQVPALVQSSVSPAMILTCNRHPSMVGPNKGFINDRRLFAGHSIPLCLKSDIFRCNGKIGC